MNDIRKILPHRRPFLFVDRIDSRRNGEWVKGYKHLSWADWFFDEESENPVMPYLFAVEAIAQLSAFLDEESPGDLGFLSSIQAVHFRNQAFPGDRLDLTFTLIKRRRGFIIGKGEARVNGKLVVEVGQLTVYQQAIS